MTRVLQEVGPVDGLIVGAAPALPLWQRMLPSAAVVVGYMALGCAAYWPVFPDVSHRIYGIKGISEDYTLSVWFIGWIPHALAHGLNPFFTNALFAPSGVNLAQNTESPLLGLAAAPVTELWGPIVATNLLMVLALPLSATAAFIVLRKWRVWLPAAALGGLLYGFSAFMVGQGTEHLVFTFAPLPPFIALIVVSIVRRQGEPRKLGIALGLFVVGQFLISQELLVETGIVAAIGLVCIAIRHPGQMASVVRGMAVPFGTAICLAAVLIAYPLWMLVDGPQHATTSKFSGVTPFYNDLLSFVVPGPLQQNSLGMGSLGRQLMIGVDPIGAFGVLVGSNPVEVGAYVGIPLLLCAVFLLWRARRIGRMQLVTVLFLTSAVLSLGSHLVIGAHATGLPLPFIVVDHLPLVRDIYPSRISFAAAACFAAVIAFGLDNLHRVPGSRRSAGVVAVLVCVSLLATQVPRWPYSTQAVLPLPASFSKAIPPGDPITITYPPASGTSMQAMTWQIQTGYRFRIFGGYANATDPRGQMTTRPWLAEPPDLGQLLVEGGVFGPYGKSPRPSPSIVASTRAAVARYHVGLVIVDRLEPGSGSVVKLFTEAIGPPRASPGWFSLWVPRS